MIGGFQNGSELKLGVGGADSPSTIPNPDRRMGTKETDSGWIWVVEYSNPRGVVSWW